MKQCHLWMASAAIALFFTGAAAAQPRAKGFSLDRFEPADRGSRWFYVESLDERYAAGVVFDYANRPLVLYPPSGKETVAIVEHQLFAHVGGTIVLTKRLRLALSIPIALFQEGEAVRVSTMVFESDQATTLGDIRVGGDVVLAGQYGDRFMLSAGLQVFAPTGSRQSFTSNGATRLLPRLNVAGQTSILSAAAQLGFRLRAWSDDVGFHVGPKDNDFAGSPMGGDAVFAAAAGVKLDHGRITFGPEFSFATAAGDRSAFLAARTTSAEVLLGGHIALAGFRVGAGAGPGLTQGFGTPAIRAVCSLEWVQPSAPPAPSPPSVATIDRDRDHDGVVNAQDACPDERGVPSKDPKTSGCPRPPDRDADGVPDTTDACPHDAGVRSDDPKINGCPKPADGDGDGVRDEEDACPNEAGVRTDDPKTDGCPGRRVRAPTDRDEDGIPDAEDACPDAEGPKLEYHPDKTGCPLARVEEGRIKLREGVEFATGGATLLVYSQAVLKAVLRILQHDPSIRHVKVQAHTDSQGNPDRNKALSQRRAAAVLKWLVARGVDPARLSAQGLGDEQPIDSNDTEAGRLNNRRIEFVIVGSDAGSTQ